MRKLIDEMYVEVCIQNEKYSNIYLFLGDFFVYNHYRKLTEKLLQEKYNVFIFEYSKPKLEGEYSDTFLDIFQKLHETYHLCGEDILIGHSKGAHIVMLMSQVLGMHAKYILLNPLIRISGFKAQTNKLLVLECIRSVFLHHNIQLTFKHFVKRFLDEEIPDDVKKNIFEHCKPIGVRGYLSPTIIDEYRPNSYTIFYSKEDNAINPELLEEKIKYLKETWKLEIKLCLWSGGHCNFMFSDDENIQKLLVEIRNIFGSENYG